MQATQRWEYATVPLLVHATKQILDNWGEDGWELVAVVPGPNSEQLVAYLKRPKAGAVMNDARARLADLGLTLPTVTPPLAAYIPAVQTGNHVYVSGQVPMVEGALLASGKVGAEVSPERPRSWPASVPSTGWPRSTGWSVSSAS